MRELAQEWLCDASNATFIVDRLEERGLAERRSVPTDRRVKMVVLTARGNRMRGRVLERFFEPPPDSSSSPAPTSRRSATPSGGSRSPTGGRPPRRSRRPASAGPVPSPSSVLR